MIDGRVLLTLEWHLESQDQGPLWLDTLMSRSFGWTVRTNKGVGANEVCDGTVGDENGSDQGCSGTCKSVMSGGGENTKPSGAGPLKPSAQ